MKATIIVRDENGQVVHRTPIRLKNRNLKEPYILIENIPELLAHDGIDALNSGDSITFTAEDIYNG